MIGLLAGCVLKPLVALPHPEPAVRWVLAEDGPISVDVHALQTGETDVSFGQFFGGHDGWVGRRGVWRTGFDRRSFRAPVLVFALVHPTEGVILVDAGLAPHQTERGFYRPKDGGRTAYIWDHRENHLPEDETLLAQLAAAGIAADDVRHVVVTHLHEDHVGQLETFDRATVHLSALEWEDRGRVAYGPSFDDVQQWNLVDGVTDLFGDGSVQLLPTPGHTLGHTSVLARVVDGGAAVVTGDAVYTLRHLDPDTLLPFNYYGEHALQTQAESVRRLTALQRDHGDLVFLLPHDPFDYTPLILDVLGDGVLDRADRRALEAVQRELFDAQGRLLPEHVPTWVRGQGL
ncbi:MAG: MBL fold metallo-hydrolase [Myxococcales bacterium]|nr:MBL fold metallo-hydrolase [Myxococcales bacterium]